MIVDEMKGEKMNFLKSWNPMLMMMKIKAENYGNVMKWVK